MFKMKMVLWPRQSWRKNCYGKCGKYFTIEIPKILVKWTATCCIRLREAFKIWKTDDICCSCCCCCFVVVVVADSVAVATVAAVAAVGTSDAVDLICDLQQVSINKKPLKMRPHQPPHSPATPTCLFLCLREGYIDLGRPLVPAWGETIVGEYNIHVHGI